MLEETKKKLQKVLRVVLAATFLFNVSPKKLIAAEQPSEEEMGIKISNGFSVDIKGAYVEYLDKILENKSYEESMKTNLREVFAEIDKNYDKYAAVEEGTIPKKQFVDDLINTMGNKCEEAVLVEEQDEGSKEDKELEEAEAIGLAGSNGIIVKDLEDKDSKKVVTLHELAHLTQDGFQVNSDIPNGYKLRRLLIEANATESGKYALGPKLENSGALTLDNKSDNTYVEFNNSCFSYEIFLNVYKKLEYLTDKKFMEGWKKDGNTEKDYFKKMGQIIDGKYGKGTFEPIFHNLIKIAPYIGDGQIEYSEDKEKIKEESLNSKQFYLEKLNRMEDKQKFMEDAKKDIDFYNNNIKVNIDTLNDSNLLEQKYNERIESNKISIENNLEEISKCSDDEKRAEYLIELKNNLEQSNDPQSKNFYQTKIEDLNDPEKRNEYIKNVQDSTEYLRQDINTLSKEKFEKDLNDQNKWYKEESDNLLKYSDPAYYDSEMKRLKETCQLYDVAMEGIEGNVPDFFVALEHSVTDCMEKDIGKVRSTREAALTVQDWHLYKKQFLLKVYTRNENNGCIRREQRDEFDIEGVENRLSEKINQFKVFPSYYKNENFNKFAQEALMDSQAYDIRTAFVKTAEIDDKAVMIIYDNAGKIQDINEFSKDGKQNIYANKSNDDPNSCSLGQDIMYRLPEPMIKQLQSSDKKPAMNRNSSEMGRRGVENRDVR